MSYIKIKKAKLEPDKFGAILKTKKNDKRRKN
jgi:hypothetical protein